MTKLPLHLKERWTGMLGCLVVIVLLLIGVVVVGWLTTSGIFHAR